MELTDARCPFTTSELNKLEVMMLQSGYIAVLRNSFWG